MNHSFAIKLMNRPEACRWIVTPSPNNKKKVAALLVDYNNGIATVIDEKKKYKKTWNVPIELINYR